MFTHTTYSSSSSSSDDGMSTVLDELTQEMLQTTDEAEIIQRAVQQQRDDEAEHVARVGEGSRPRRKRKYTNRERVLGGIRLYKDYFAPSPTYSSDLFRRRFRMRQSLFETILEGIQRYDDYFTQKIQCTGELGLTPYQKMTAAMRMLANGCSADSVDEYIRIGETTTFACLKHFCKAVIAVFGKEYLREPTAEDMAKLLAENAARGFPGMIGSVDCMHWEWKNCPKAWAGAFTGYKGICSIILEAVASYNLRFWHIFFGMPGSCNDINVINQSDIFDSVLRGESPPVEYTVNRRQYQLPYYLGDGIYPKLATIVKTIPLPRSAKENLFARTHESVRKDVERAFGVFQARWAIIRQPAMSWSKKQLHEIMVACVIMHNMIVEDEPPVDPMYYDQDHAAEPFVQPSRAPVQEYQARAAIYAKIHSQAMHLELRGSLIEHMWAASGNR